MNQTEANMNTKSNHKDSRPPPEMLAGFSDRFIGYSVRLVRDVE